MTRPGKVAITAGVSLVLLSAILFVAGIVVVQTAWFRNFVRAKIVSAVEDATGGRVDIAAFTFDWTHLRAEVRGFTIHGLEPATAAPLLTAQLVRVDLRPGWPSQGWVAIAYLLVDTPRANVIVYPDGRTNVPAPKIQPRHSDKTGVETIVDLAVGRFDLRQGQAAFADRQSALDASGSNLRAQLSYNMVASSYSGEIDVSPLRLQSGGNPALDVNVRLPLTVGKDKITLANAQIETVQSRVVISGAMDHLVSPRTSARVNAFIALEEVRRALGLPLDTARGPRMLTADLAATMDGRGIQIQNARATLGHSQIEASGTLEDAGRNPQLRFNSTVALGEVGALLRLSAHPQGTLQAAGDASLGGDGSYKVTANLDARGVAVRLGNGSVSGLALDSAVTADNHRIQLSNLRLAVLGGEFTGSAALQDLAQFHLSGALRHFDIARISRALALGISGYDGVISGPLTAEGSIRDSAALVAKAGLEIAPGANGIPVSGHLGINYNGRAGLVDVDHSHISLPHTSVAFSGSLGNSIQVHLVSRNFADFRPIAAIPVTFNGSGAASLDAVVAGSLRAPRIAAQVAATNFTVDGRPFTRFAAAVSASPSAVSVTNASLSHGSLLAQFSASAGLRGWKPENDEPLKADLVIHDADLRDLLALAGQGSFPAAGALEANAHIAGSIGSPTGAAGLSVARGALDGEPFDNLALQVALDRTSINLQSLHLSAGPSRIDATANYRHPVNDLGRGAVTAHLSTNQVQLAQFQSLVRDRPGLAGLVNLNADVAGSLAPAPAGFQISTVSANLAARHLAMEGKALGDFELAASTSGGAVRYNVNSDFAGSEIRVNGQSLLTGGHQTSATASIANLPVDRLLALAGRRDLPVRGTLSANAQVSGTLQNPRGSGTVTVANGSAFAQPFNRIQASLDYTDVRIEVPQFRIDDGPSHLELSAGFSHPAGDLQDGQVQFHVNSNEFQLSRIHALVSARPGLAGVVQLNAEGAAALHRSAPIAFSSLNTQFSARGLSIDRKALGDLSANAVMRGGGIEFTLNSNLAKSRIQGSGRLDLTQGYPLNAQLAVSDVTWSGLSPLLGGAAEPFDASLDGKITVSGPAAQPAGLRGSLELTKLEAHSVAANGGKAARVKFALQNAGAIQASLANSVVTVRNFQLTGPYSNLAIGGTASLNGAHALNLRANGNIKLDALEAFSSDIFSSGSVALNAAVTGSTSRPVINGRLQLQNASFQMMTLPNGLSNANGAIDFNGTEAVIDNLSGQVGGGKVTLAGYAAYGGAEPLFRIQANATRVHIDYPETITTEASARLTLAGSESKSMLTGNVTVQSVAMHSHSDIGSILTSAATPPSSATPSTGILAGMRFDVRVRTAVGAQFRTSLTQGLQADADLDLRGSPDHPGMLGRIAVTSGDVIFFGAKYTVDEGAITFYNPNKVEPTLNVTLETTVQGVDVSVSVSGPLERMKLAYHSDPPLEFDQIVSLLASGKTPTTDPVLAAHQPPAPQQSIGQVGASAVLSQAVANPVSGRLQRLFGVSKLSIDPQIVGETSNNPQATLTLQQQITKEITFTYIQDVTATNPSAIRIEWAINPRFSAVAQRDVYGEFALDFFYKRHFH